MKKKYLWMALMCVLVLSLVPLMTACGDDDNNEDDGPSTPNTGSTLSGSINIIGSNTVTPISTFWAEAFMDANTKVNISVSGPGSGVGIAQLINGTTDIAQASRAMKESEIEDAQDNGIMANEIRVATDALAVVVHPDNPVNELTIAQISGIYTGRITNWSEIGGNDESIVVLSRDTSSGTHVFFKEHVVQMAGLPTEDTSLEYGSKVQLLSSTEAGVTEVAQNEKAIFYPGLGYVTDKVKPLGIKKTADDPAVLPSLETALDGSYPISRPLFFYTDGQPTGLIKAFVDFCLSAQGQEYVLEAGYVPLA